MNKNIIYYHPAQRPRIAVYREETNEYGIFTGKRGGSLKHYKKVSNMDAAMLKIGYKRRESNG